MVTLSPSSLKLHRWLASVYIGCGGCHTQSSRSRTGVSSSVWPLTLVTTPKVTSTATAIRPIGRNQRFRGIPCPYNCGCCSRSRASRQTSEPVDRSVLLQNFGNQRLERRPLAARRRQIRRIFRMVARGKFIGLIVDVVLVDPGAAAALQCDFATDEDGVDRLPRLVHHEMVPDVSQRAVHAIRKIVDREIGAGTDTDRAERFRFTKHGTAARGRHAHGLFRRDPAVAVRLTDATTHHPALPLLHHAHTLPPPPPL